MDVGGGSERPEKTSRPSIFRCVSMAALGICLGVFSAAGLASGCGTELGPLSPNSSGASTTITAGSGSSTTTTTGLASSTTINAPSSTPTVTSSVPRTAVAVVFSDMARMTAPTPVYGLTELPSEVTIPAAWWPVLSASAPGDYPGPVVPNPRIGGVGPGAREAQLVLKMGDGWLIVLENFRGDLGDVVGSPVGQVAGHPAALYALNGGVLVQWSDRGAWYGVFGRGIPRAEVIRTALSMTLVVPSH